MAYRSSPRKSLFFHPGFYRRVFFRLLASAAFLIAAWCVLLKLDGYFWFLIASAVFLVCAGDLRWNTIHRAIRVYERMQAVGRDKAVNSLKESDET